MGRIRRTVLAGICVVALGATLLSAGEPERAAAVDGPQRAELATQVAAAWFDALLGGDVAVAGALSEVPFALDRKQVIETSAELDKIYRAILAKKGKRTIKPDAVRVAAEKKEIVDGCVPVDVLIVEITIAGDDERIRVAVRPGDTYKVVGFSD